MHWLDAATKSKDQMAIRRDRQGRIFIRSLDGKAYAQPHWNFNPEVIIEVHPSTSEGFNDWKPREE